MSSAFVFIFLSIFSLTVYFSIGDAGDAALAMMIVRTCEGIEGGLPPRLRMMMLINVIVDFFMGLVPFIGDIADAVYKCNTRNAVILEKHLREKGAKALKNQAQPREQKLIDPSLPDQFDKQESGVVDNSLSDPNNQQPIRPVKPRPKKSNKWFGGANPQDEDLERGP